VISLRRLILHNFWLKFSSVALAMVMWLAVHHSIHSDTDILRSQLNLNRLLAQEYIRVPISVKTASGDMRLFRITPSDAVVIVVGENAALRRAAIKDIRVNVDMTDLDAKESVTRKLQADAPPDINVIDISPSEVQVQQVSP
jgi:hypothetical protein